LKTLIECTLPLLVGAAAGAEYLVYSETSFEKILFD
jgi:hypothetical protein